MKHTGCDVVRKQHVELPPGDHPSLMLGTGLGSTSIVTDASGGKTAEQRYKAWGETRYTWGTLPTDYTFTGQYSYISDFNLMFYNARWYDPALGRFIQADTIVPDKIQGVQAWDRYAYTNNDPVRFTDPNGKAICDEDGNCFDKERQHYKGPRYGVAPSKELIFPVKNDIVSSYDYLPILGILESIIHLIHITFLKDNGQKSHE